MELLIGIGWQLGFGRAGSVSEAEHDPEWSGVEWSGVEWSGVEWRGGESTHM